METLTTHRLILRPFRLDDVNDVLSYVADPEWQRFYANVPPPTPEETKRLVTRFADRANWNTFPIFAVTVRDQVIGEVYLNNFDHANERAEMGYALARERWGQGIAVEATGAVMDWAFQEFRLNRIYSSCDPRNTRSIRVMEKLGMTREGLLRQHGKFGTEYRDALYYGILRDEWEKRKRGKTA